MTLSVIIPAMDEAATLQEVLAQVRRLGPAETLVVANGPGAGAVVDVARQAGARVLRYEEPLGHDVGRALGAAAATGEVLLFVDADLPVAAGDLLAFVRAVLFDEVDVALNRIDAYVSPPARAHPVNAAKRYLTALLGRPDLGYASLTAVPHALSRRALSELGPAALAVPPLALAQAVAAGLRIDAVHPVDVVRFNARRPGLNLGRSSPVEQLILGDHAEAVAWLAAARGGSRGACTDLGRRRDLLPHA